MFYQFLITVIASLILSDLVKFGVTRQDVSNFIWLNLDWIQVTRIVFQKFLIVVVISRFAFLSSVVTEFSVNRGWQVFNFFISLRFTIVWSLVNWLIWIFVITSLEKKNLYAIITSYTKTDRMLSRYNGPIALWTKF